jgi:hypothetical protein
MAASSTVAARPPSARWRRQKPRSWPGRSPRPSVLDGSQSAHLTERVGGGGANFLFLILECHLRRRLSARVSRDDAQRPDGLAPRFVTLVFRRGRQDCPGLINRCLGLQAGRADYCRQNMSGFTVYLLKLTSIASHAEPPLDGARPIPALNLNVWIGWGRPHGPRRREWTRFAQQAPARASNSLRVDAHATAAGRIDDWLDSIAKRNKA